MTSLTIPRNTIRLGDHTLVELPDFKIAAATTIYEGCLVALNSSGYLVDGGAGAAAKVIGIADDTVDNSAGAAGDLSVAVRRGAHKLDNSSANPVVQASLYLKTMKAEDNHTICVAAGTGVAIGDGRILKLDADGGVWVEFY